MLRVAGPAGALCSRGVLFAREGPTIYVLAHRVEHPGSIPGLEAGTAGAPLGCNGYYVLLEGSVEDMAFVCLRMIRRPIAPPTEGCVAIDTTSCRP